MDHYIAVHILLIRVRSVDRQGPIGLMIQTASTIFLRILWRRTFRISRKKFEYVIGIVRAHHHHASLCFQVGEGNLRTEGKYIENIGVVDDLSTNITAPKSPVSSQVGSVDYML